MVGFFFWRKKEDDEKVLAHLDGQIRVTERRISHLQQRHKKLKSAWLYYSVPFYTLVVVAYFTYLKPRKDPWDIWLWKTGFMVLGAPCIYGVNKLIKYWYTSKETSEKEWLEQLKKQQREKVEQLKRDESYRRTQLLLERYDTPVKGERPPTPNTPNGLIPSNPHLLSPQSPGPQGGSDGSRTPSPALPTAELPIPIAGQAAAQPARRSSPENFPASKGWFDKIIDIMIGETEGPANKYALICEECFTHNGLVPPEAYSTARFRCMRCDHLNVPKEHIFVNPVADDSRRSSSADIDSPTPNLFKRHRASMPEEILLRNHEFGPTVRRRNLPPVARDSRVDEVPSEQSATSETTEEQADGRGSMGLEQSEASDAMDALAVAEPTKREASPAPQAGN